MLESRQIDEADQLVTAKTRLCTTSLGGLISNPGSRILGCRGPSESLTNAELNATSVVASSWILYNTPTKLRHAFGWDGIHGPPKTYEAWTEKSIAVFIENARI